MTPPTRRRAADASRFADSAPNAEQVRLGQYLVRVGDCRPAIPRDGRRALGGGFGLNTPFGTIYCTNLTSDPQHRHRRLDRRPVLRRPCTTASAAHGEQLYPAMPYPYFTRVTRADSDAILAFLKTMPAVH